MLRNLVFLAALAVVPCVARAQDTTHHDSSAVARKTNNTVNNAGEGVKQANDQVDNSAYKVGTDIKHIFKPKKKPQKPDSTAVRDSTQKANPRPPNGRK